MLEDTAQATEWFMQLIGIVPTDPAILARLGELYDNEGDKSQAYQYHYEVRHCQNCIMFKDSSKMCILHHRRCYM